MAITPSDFADISANSTFLGQTANKTAYTVSNLLKSGFVIDASVKGTFSPLTNKVSFPEWDFTNVVKAALPSDGSGTGNSYNATHKYVDANVSTNIISAAYQEAAVLAGVGGLAEYLEELGNHVGLVMAGDIEVAAVAAAVAKDSSKITTDAGNDPTYARVMKAAVNAFGASFKPSETAFVVNPAIYAKLITESNYVSAAHSSLRDLSGAPIETYAGMALIVTDGVVADGSTATASNCLLLKRGGLQVYMNGAMRMKTVHREASDTEVLDCIYGYAVHRTSGSPNPARVVQFKTA